jgi:AraC-like DNA-binding protein
MQVKFNKNAIESMLSDIRQIIGVPITFFDETGKVIATPPKGNMSEFCATVRASETGRKLCSLSDENGCKLCREKGDSVTYRCHAGVYETATPVIFENTVIGYIIFGQYLKPNQEPCNDKNLLPLFNELPTLTDDKIRAVCNVLRSCILSLYLADAVAVERNELSSSIKEYINDNLSDKITVESLCSKFFINKKRLYSIFNREFGQTVKQYLLSARLTKAKHLLATTDLSVTEISEKVGFIDYNNFIQRFKKVIGASPLKYRKTLQADEKYARINKEN